MEEHIKKFCELNPTTEFECPNCKTINKIQTMELAKIKYEYTFNCVKCNDRIKINTKELHKTLEFF